MVISVLTICLVPKLQLGNAVPRSYASPALRLPHLNTCLGGKHAYEFDFHELPRSGRKTIAGGKRSATTEQSKYHCVNAAI